DLQGKQAVVIGAGEVAARKVKGLIEAGAVVKLVSPEIHPELQNLQGKNLSIVQREYRTGDLEGAFLAVASTDDPLVNRKVREEASQKKIILNVIDKPDLCDFTFSSRVQQGEFLLTISTGGASPALAKKVREELENQFGPEYGTLTAILFALRVPIKKEKGKEADGLFAEFVRSPILNWIRERDEKKIDQLMSRLFGEKYSLEQIGIKL
ncbi:MAG: bifunctional precorrin-2 dehydrogenase/sirohydrochlorin ferrochelatase, partial [Deltaproteobacteria bacterium]|nr:bifunctional precorrin-2 dehydrogenase/sirohydrochlorin ferrochelatase [Deltaproteobacteria bacterium]